LAARKAIRPQDIIGETFIAPTKAAPALKAVIDDYAARSGIRLKPEYEAENLFMAMSLVASTGGITLLPLYAENLLSPSVVTRPLHGDVPTIDLVIGYNKSNTSALLKSMKRTAMACSNIVDERQRYGQRRIRLSNLHRGFGQPL
jgi:LysR family hca operon transcriptional activator